MQEMEARRFPLPASQPFPKSPYVLRFGQKTESNFEVKLANG
jgi:hypothetical protein